MSEIHLDEQQVRLQKLTQLKQAGIIPYANKFDKQQSSADLISIAEDTSLLQDIDQLMESGASHAYSTAGRLMMFRSHGKLSFGTIRDDVGDIQISFVRGKCHFNTGKEVVDSIHIAGSEISSYKFVEKYFDVGDFIGVKGDLFLTKHGELTLFVDEFQMLSKALRPLGDKWHGIKDEEKIYRQRYLDMTMNQSSYDRFIFKSKFYKALRNFYDSQGFHEIVTSVLGNAASGAAAKPFKTHHNDFDLEVFLRIAFEPALKMATVGRYEKVYEIGKDFRNEGSDPSHLQEFTQVEHYAAYWNYEDNMRFAEAMFDYLFEALQLNTIISIKDKEGNSREVNRSTPRQRIDYIQGVKDASGGLDITHYGMEDEEQLRTDIKALGHERVGMEQQGVTTMIDYLYKKVLRPSIVGPAFVYNYPKTMQPLARGSDEDPNIVEQFQVVVNGREIIKAYSELVDPTVQEANFEEQGIALEKGDEEATSGDDDFMLAMEHGMPCQSGFGMGLERILALLTGQDNLRDVVMFPLMKPIQEHGESKIQNGDGVDIKSSVEEEKSTMSQSIDDTNSKKRTLLGEVNDLGSEIDFVPGFHDDFRIRKAVRIIAEKEGKIRMIHNKKYDYYALPGGGIEKGEMLEDAMHREVREEGGVILSSFRKLGKVNLHRFSTKIKLFQEDYCFVGSVKAEVDTAYKPHEIEEGYSVDWYENKEALSMLKNQYIKYGNNNNATSKSIVLLTESEIIMLEEYVGIDASDSDKSQGNTGSQSKDTEYNGDIEGLINSYLTDTKLHCQQVGFVMQAFARDLGEDETLRYAAGVLHDIDRDHIGKNAEEHLGAQFDDIMDELGADEYLRRAIKSHYPDGTGVQPESLLEKYLISVDELTGFLYAYARMRPEGYEGMKRKSINKKIKDKQFAAGVDREHLRNCEKYLGIPLDQFALSVVSLCNHSNFPTT